MEDYVENWFKLVEQSCRKQDYSEELRDLRQAVRFGDAHAMYILGQMYEYGEGVKKDYKKAKSYYGKAAVRGHVNAMYELGHIHDSCCWHGIRKRRDFEKAEYWYKRAANKGSIEAKYKLDPDGDYYLYDFGGLAKPAKAYSSYDERLFREAYAGDADAMYELGTRYEYENSYYGDPCFQHAIEWYFKAARKGLKCAINKLVDLCYLGKKMTKYLGDIVECNLKAAASGNEIAMLNLGRMYYYGENVAKDYSKAFKWFNEAAGRGNAIGMYQIGYMYYYGLGVKQDYTKAFERFHKLFITYRLTTYEHEDISRKEKLKALLLAGCSLGKMYEYGKGVCQDYEKARALYSLASNAGSTEAEYRLGRMEAVYGFNLLTAYSYREAAEGRYLNYPNNDIYVEGYAQAGYELAKMYEKGLVNDRDEEWWLEQGIKSNDEKAFYWYFRAARNGSLDAEYIKAEWYFTGRGTKKDCRKAFYCYSKAAEAGHAMAMYKVGRMYECGFGVKADYKKASLWYRRAVEKGLPDGMYALGEIYFWGLGVKVYYPKALVWYRKAAAKGSADAQYMLGYMSERGIGVGQDYDEAVKWYQKAAASGHAMAVKSIGDAYFRGDGREQNYSIALNWYKSAANLGQAEAAYMVGLMYEKGWGTTANHKTAVEWYKKACKIKGSESVFAREAWKGNARRNFASCLKAAEAGNADAMYALGRMFDYSLIKEPDSISAFRWYIKAASAGNKEAVNALLCLCKLCLCNWVSKPDQGCEDKLLQALLEEKEAMRSSGKAQGNVRNIEEDLRNVTIRY